MPGAVQSGSTALPILLVEDSPLIRHRLSLAIAGLPYVTLQGWAESSHRAIQEIRKLRPAIVVLDLSLRHGTGFDVLESFRDTPSSPAFLVYTGTADSTTRKYCFALGAKGVFDKCCELPQLLESIAKLGFPETGFSGIGST